MSELGFRYVGLWLRILQSLEAKISVEVKRGGRHRRKGKKRVRRKARATDEAGFRVLRAKASISTRTELDSMISGKIESVGGDMVVSRLRGVRVRVEDTT